MNFGATLIVEIVKQTQTEQILIATFSKLMFDKKKNKLFVLDKY